MRSVERIVLAVAVVVVDLVAVFVPLTAILAAWILLTRPPWFKSWVERLYEGDDPPSRGPRAPREARAPGDDR